ncbi:MAG: ComEA family DNA-binding protein [Sediminibacterium sp.]
MKKIIKDYLQFSKKERIGLVILLLLLGLILYLPKLIKPSIQALQPSDTAWLKEMEYVENNKTEKATNSFTKEVLVKPTYFYFNPNSASENQLVSLGLTPKNVQTIVRYRNKGGQFRLPEDFLKIWGIDPAVAKALIPFIRIPEQQGPNQYQGVKRNRGYDETFSPKKIPNIDINEASIATWELLPGIGPVLAARIVKFREKLGGFAEIEEVKKTYGISDSLYVQIKPFLQLNNTEKPSINTASAALLQKVGVSPAIAVAIVTYRKQYGLFDSLEDLKKIVFIQPTQFQELLQLVKL